MSSFHIYPTTWSTDAEGIIHIFGLTPASKSIHVEVSGFTPYMYMELPGEIDWTEVRKQSILSTIADLPGEIQPTTKSFMYKRKLYHANVVKVGDTYEYKKYPYLFVAFPNKEAQFEFMKKMRYGIYIAALGRKIRFKFHEQDATPVLQMTACRKLPMTGWIDGSGKIQHDMMNTSYCDFEYQVRWETLSPCTDSTILMIIPNPKVLMFDCEANSSNIATMPNNRPDDKLFQISFAVMTHGNYDEKGAPIVEKHILSLGTLLQDKVGDDVVLHTYQCEGDLLVDFSRLICEINPQIIGGYNILGWDFEYMIKRAKLTGVFSEFTKFGALRGVEAKEKKISWSSSAFNSQNFTMLDAPGRLLIDMLPIVRRDFKLSRYDLGSVATEILGQTKDPLTHKGIFKCYRMMTPQSMSLVARYCVQDSNVTLLLFEKLKSWIGSCQLSNTFNVPIIDLYTQGQQWKIYSQVYKLCLERNIVVEKDAYTCAANESYTGAIVLDPVPGMFEDIVIFDFASLYPSVMIAKNICYSTLVIDPDIPDEDCHVMKWHDCIGGPHDTVKRNTKVKKIICCDRKYRFLKKPVGILPSLLMYLTSERKKTNAELKLVEEDIKKCIDPAVKFAKQQYAIVLNLKQLSLKISSNSIYGGMGVTKGRLPFMPGAMCTTAGGRDALMLAKKTITEKFPGQSIYGDTDSLMYHYTDETPYKVDGKTDSAKLVAHSKAVAAEVTKDFPEPMKLEFECACKDFLMITKKKYVTALFGGKQKRRGIMVQRRDNAPCCRNIYEGILKMIFEHKPEKDVEVYVIESLNEIYSHKFSTRDYAITKSIKEIDQYKIKYPDKDPVKRAKQYRNKFLDPDRHTDADYLLRSLPAHVQLAERMRRRGMFVEAGSRLEYIVSIAGGIKGKMWQKIESVDYYRDHSDIIRLDMSYYCKSLVNPGDQLMEVRYGKKNFFKDQRDLRIIKDECLTELRKLFEMRLDFQ